MQSFKLIVAVSALFALPLAAHAQWAVSPQILISIPESDFANVAETGGGFGVKAVRSFSKRNAGFGIRGDFSFLTFGRQNDVALDSFGLPVPIEQRNEGFRLTTGPAYTIGGRNLRLFASATGGVYFFRTNVTATFNTGTGTGFFQDSRDNNWALGWNVGAGLQYDIGLGPWLDVSFEYQTIYDLPGPTAKDENGEPIDGAPRPDVTAHEYTIKVGVIFFLGR